MRNTLIVHALIRLDRQYVRHVSINVTRFCLTVRACLYVTRLQSWISLFSAFFFFWLQDKRFLSLLKLRTWRETTILSLWVNVKMKLYLASADLTAEQWNWQTQRDGEKERKGPFLLWSSPLSLIHSTTRNRETLGSCRSRIWESRPIVVCILCVCVCMCLYVCKFFVQAYFYLSHASSTRVCTRSSFFFPPLVLVFFFRNFRSRGCKP